MVFGVLYEGGHQGCFRSKIDAHYDEFVSRLHTIIGVNPKEYLIIVTSRHPCEVGSYGMKFVCLDVSNDDSLEVALTTASESTILQHAEFYVDVIQYDEEEIGMQDPMPVSPEMTLAEEVNSCFENGASSRQQEVRPNDAIVNVISQENTVDAYTGRVFSEIPEDSDGDEEDEIIEEIDNEDNISDDDDEVEPLHDPGSSFYHDIGEDTPCGYYTPPGVYNSSDYDHETEELKKGLLFNDKESLHHEAYWDEYVGPTWIPDARLLRNRGRPRSTRFTNEMDVRSTNKCSLCRVQGHTRRTCTLAAGQRSAARDMQ